MKILTEEEKTAHWNATLSGGLKGLVAGGVISAGFIQFLRVKYPARWSTFAYNLRTAISITPPTFGCVVWAEEASNSFDRQTYAGAFDEKAAVDEANRWKNLSAQDKMIESISAHKYKVIIAGWAASMYGSWVVVNRDKIMTTAQKAVQARMYAQAVTVLMLLGTVVLSTLEEQESKNKPKPIPEWRLILAEEEQKQKEKELLQKQLNIKVDV